MGRRKGVIFLQTDNICIAFSIVPIPSNLPSDSEFEIWHIQLPIVCTGQSFSMEESMYDYNTPIRHTVPKA